MLDMNFTYEFPETPGLTSDTVEYNKDGIIRWFLYSEYLKDQLIPVSLDWIKSNWPDKFYKLEQELIERYDEVYLEHINSIKLDELRDV